MKKLIYSPMFEMWNGWTFVPSALSDCKVGHIIRRKGGGEEWRVIVDGHFTKDGIGEVIVEPFGKKAVSLTNLMPGEKRYAIKNGKSNQA